MRQPASGSRDGQGRRDWFWRWGPALVAALTCLSPVSSRAETAVVALEADQLREELAAANAERGRLNALVNELAVRNRLLEESLKIVDLQMMRAGQPPPADSVVALLQRIGVLEVLLHDAQSMLDSRPAAAAAAEGVPVRRRPIDLNTASWEQLAKLPALGKRGATAIIRYRER